MTETSCCAELTSEDRWNIVLQREFLNMSAVTTRWRDFLFLNRAVWNPANWLLRLVFLKHKRLSSLLGLLSLYPSVFQFVVIPNPFLYISTSDTRYTVYTFDKLICGEDCLTWNSKPSWFFLLFLLEYCLNNKIWWVSTHWFLHKCHVWHQGHLGLLEPDVTIFVWQGWLRYLSCKMGPLLTK